MCRKFVKKNDLKWHFKLGGLFNDHRKKVYFNKFSWGRPPRPPYVGCTLMYPPFVAPWLGSALSCRWRPVPPTLLRSPPTPKVADNPALDMEWLSTLFPNTESIIMWYEYNWNDLVWFLDDAAVKNRLTECLETILNKAQEPPKSKKVQHSNAKNAVLFEAINLIIHMDSDPNLLVRACNQLGQFLQHRETNLR